VNYSISVADLKGFTLKGDTDQTIGILGDEAIILALGTSGLEPKQYSLEFQLVDEFGRSVDLNVNVKLDPLEDTNGTEEKEDDDLPIPLIIGGIAVVLLIIIVIVFLLMRKKTPVEEVEEEQEEEKPVSLDYDPTGVVAEGGTGAQVNVPMAPGTLEDEEELRRRGSNVMEITIPSKDDAEEPEQPSNQEEQEPPSEEE
jgi:hypothetical protein